MTLQQLNDTFDKFFTDNNNKFVERVDPTALNQCMDLVIYWCEYLGLPRTIFSGMYSAYQVWSAPNQATKDAFNFLNNTPDFVPLKGDICVWSASYNGGPGHIGVCSGNGSNTSTFECFEQNDPTGSVSHMKVYGYSTVYGFLRLKNITSSPTNTMDNRAGNFDILWHGIVDPNADTRSVTEQQVRDVIVRYKSASNRAGQYDQVAIAAKYTQDTNQVAAMTLVNMIKAQVPQFDKQAFIDRIIAFVKTL